MTGGMICAPIDDNPWMAAENWAEYPACFITGMQKVPTAATSATPLPDIVPNSAEASTVDWPGPLRRRNVKRSASAMNSRPPPVFSRKDPKRM